MPTLPKDVHPQIHLQNKSILKFWKFKIFLTSFQTDYYMLRSNFMLNWLKKINSAVSTFGEVGS